MPLWLLKMLKNEQSKTKTNADRIRAMSDDELADWLCYFVEDLARFNGFEDNKLYDGERDRILGMLKQPVEGE